VFTLHFFIFFGLLLPIDIFGFVLSSLFSHLHFLRVVLFTLGVLLHLVFLHVLILVLVLCRVFLNFLSGQASLHLLRLVVKCVLICHLVVLVLSRLVLLLSVLFSHLWLVDLFLASVWLILLLRRLL